MLPEYFFRGFNYEINDNENRLMWSMPLFEYNSEYYIALSSPWNIENPESILKVDIKTWLGTTVARAKNKKIRPDDFTLVFGKKYYQLLKKQGFEDLLDMFRVFEIQNETYVCLISPTLAKSRIKYFFQLFISRLDNLLDKKELNTRRINEYLNLIKGTPALSDEDYLQYRIRKHYIQSSEKNTAKWTQSIKDIALDISLKITTVEKIIDEYKSQRIKKPISPAIIFDTTSASSHGNAISNEEIEFTGLIECLD